ncbi:MAG: hypothetical protein DI569_08190 [Sphingopyxis macrogoltabida]|uniref:SnoaL-like domain-containing protein n=1 Tax=Sphingopyxis macrogoltabida TaxID=33050 RepID=A0A2W5MRC9_SPHMC|nr:MAG: hypothetical protein DI569_08190 [Sphingopyxis macrogoltabida]
MKKTLIFASALALFNVAAPAAAQEKPATDVLSKMFIWWNEAFKTPGAYTPENFSKFFTPDATLVLEGRTVINGVDQWATHFQRIQSGGGDVEIVVPFKEVFEADGRVYTYHVIRSRRDGETGCSLAAGHAELEGGKIASIVLVRHTLEAGKDMLDPQCWTE